MINNQGIISINSMRNNKNFVSFLNMKSMSNYSFEKVGCYRLIEHAKLHSQKILTPSFAKHHREELQTPLFEYTVQDKYKSWRIVKRFDELINLKEELSPMYKDILLPIPVEGVDRMKDNQLPPLLDFFLHFLNTIGKTDAVQEAAFLSFVGNVVGYELKQLQIYYQGILSKRAGGRHNQGTIKKLFNLLTSWEDRLVSITPQGLYLCEKQSLNIEDSLMFSSTFTILYGQAATGNQYGIVINSAQRILSLDTKNIFNLSLFVRFLNAALQISQSTQAHRFTSFAPLRFDCDAKYYVDGQGYFSDLCQALLSAKKQIFITGWMLSPFFSLRRPDPKGQFRLDNILARVAKAGIKVYIVIYNAPKVALNIDSQFTQNYLTKLSSNIKIVLHPNYVLIPFLWSHHQKIVVIDQKVSFMGGLDIGYGRFDSKRHLLTNPTQDLWPGVDFCNYRITDILEPQEYGECSLNRKTDPRMPWHDIGVRLMGGSVQDLCRHFIQYWNYVNLQIDMNDRELLMYVGIGQYDLEAAARQEEQQKKSATKQMKDYRKGLRLTHTEDTEEQSVFNLLNFFKKKKQAKPHSETFSLPFELEPHTPKLNKSSQFFCEQTSEDKQQQAEQQRQYYVNHLQQITKFKSLVDMLNPKNILHHRMGTTFQEVTLNQGQPSIKIQKKRQQHHQILRSAAMWSIGLQQKKPERSIWNAYIHLIQNAKEHIYIQNQFFISEHNGVAQAIAKRIIKAREHSQRFKVVIMLPALPGFDGHPADQNAAVFRVQVSLILKTVNKMYDLLLQELGSEDIIQDYLFVFSLRTHGIVNKIPVTQIIYIHSKLMIVDDRVTLIGSANINDRSLKGSRDSQLAVIIEDVKLIQIPTVQGQVREVATFAHQLRKELYMEHFGLSFKDAEDYHQEDIWGYMLETAKKNHDFYRALFGCYPDNDMETYQDMQTIKQKASHSEYDILRLGIKSNAIPYQRHFLSAQNLALSPSQKQYFLPQINFT